MAEIETVELNVKGKTVPAIIVKTGAATKGFLSGLNSEVMSEVWKASDQVPYGNSDDKILDHISKRAVENPPIALHKYAEMYRRSPVQHACIETLVSDIVGSGYRIRPRAELFPRYGDRASEQKPTTDGETKIFDFVDLPMNAMESFTTVVSQMVRDKLALGQGYIEFSRSGISSKGDSGAIDGVYRVVGSTILIAKGGPQNGFYQSRGTKHRYFMRYLR